MAVIAGSIGTGPRRAIAAPGYLRATEIEEILRSGTAELASHSLTHPFLTRLDDGHAMMEIVGSRQRLESLFGHRVTTFVYPYGDHNTRIVELVRSAGYTAARTTREGIPNFRTVPLRLPAFELRRNTSLDSVKRHVTGRECAILLMHQAVAHPRYFTQWELDRFVGLVQWIRDAGIATATLAEMIARYQGASKALG